MAKDLYKVVVTGTHESAVAKSPGNIDWVQWEVLDFNKLSVAEDTMKAVEENPYGWIIFTSPRAVRYWSETLLEHNIAFPFETQIACIGQATVDAAVQDGFNPDFYPIEAGTEGFLKEFADLLSNNSARPRIVVPSALEGRTTLRETLVEWGCTVEWIPLYETVGRKDLEAQNLGEADLLVFTSPSSVDAVLAKMSLPENLKVAAIGKFTQDHLAEKGLTGVRTIPNSDLTRVAEVLC